MHEHVVDLYKIDIADNYALLIYAIFATQHTTINLYYNLILFDFINQPVSWSVHTVIYGSPLRPF
jgi:hypothetical protein